MLSGSGPYLLGERSQGGLDLAVGKHIDCIMVSNSITHFKYANQSVLMLGGPHLMIEKIQP